MILLFKGLSFQLCTVVYDLCSMAQLAWKLNNILRGFNPLRAVAHFHLVWANCWQQLSDCVTSAGLAHSSSYADKVPSHSLVASLRTAVLFVHQECSAQKIARCNLTLRTRQGDSQCLGILANFTVNKQTENLIFFLLPHPQAITKWVVMGATLIAAVCYSAKRDEHAIFLRTQRLPGILGRSMANC